MERFGGPKLAGPVLQSFANTSKLDFCCLPMGELSCMLLLLLILLLRLPVPTFRDLESAGTELYIPSRRSSRMGYQL